MKSATRLTVSTFGTIAALAGIEHGIGEVLQGNRPPDGIVFLSWPDSAFFHILGGEPAMSVVPNLLATGILAILVSLILLVWVIAFVERKYGGLVVIILSIILLLVGGGVAPSLVGVIVGAAGTRIGTPLPWWRKHLSVTSRRVLAKVWPWSFTAGLIAWLVSLPGVSILDYFFGVSNETFVFAVIVSAFSLLPLTIFAGFAYDLREDRVSNKS